MSQWFDDYQTELDKLRFSPEQKARLAEAAARAAGETGRTRRPVRRTVLLAAALVAALAVGAGATGALRPVAEVFAPLFGEAPAQTEILDKIGRPIGASDTAGGVTITADAILGDAYNACVIYTISRDDGTVFDWEGNELGYLPLLFRNGDTDLNIRGGSHGGSYFIDQVPGDNAIQYVHTITSSDKPLKAGTARAEFEDLCYFDEAAGEAVTLVEGTWKLSFDVAYEDLSVSLKGGETFEQDGMTFTVDRVTVSPLAVRVAYTVDSQAVWSDAPSGRQSDRDRETTERYFENVEVLLTKADGTVLDLSRSGGSISPKRGGTVCTKGGLLEQITHLEELESISVGGVVYPISAD